MRGTGLEKEVEICATNITNKTKCMSTHAKKSKPSKKRSTKKAGEAYHVWKHITHNLQSVCDLIYVSLASCSVVVSLLDSEDGGDMFLRNVD
jgi:hypothetical protein